jgi:hypothetical protein
MQIKYWLQNRKIKKGITGSVMFCKFISRKDKTAITSESDLNQKREKDESTLQRKQYAA